VDLVKLGTSCLLTQEFSEAEKYFKSGLDGFVGTKRDRLRVLKKLYEAMTGRGYGVVSF
jgi:uncharacterized protein HemY